MTQEHAQLLADLRESEQQFISVRRDIHAHPELGFAETLALATAAILVDFAARLTGLTP